MPRRLLIDRINQIESMLGEVALIRVRVDPDGEKFCAQIAPPRLVEAEMSEVFGIGRTNIEAFVKKPLRSVGMGINDQRRIMNLPGSRADDNVRPPWTTFLGPELRRGS